jgi:hypothetical protein
MAASRRPLWLDDQRLLLEQGEGDEAALVVVKSNGAGRVETGLQVDGAPLGACAAPARVIYRRDHRRVAVVDLEAMTVTDVTVSGRVDGASGDCRFVWTRDGDELILFDLVARRGAASVRGVAGELVVRASHGLLDTTGAPQAMFSARAETGSASLSVPWEAVAPWVSRPNLLGGLLAGRPIVPIE